MTFDQLKSIILSRAKPLEICEAYHAVLLSGNQTDLINAALSTNILPWVYESGVVDDALLTEFTESNNNSFGIYTTGTPTINNPTLPIYLLKNCDATINVADVLKLKLIVLGNAKAHIILSDFAHANISVGGTGWIELTSDADSSACITLERDGQAIITANNRSVVHLKLRNGSKLTFMGTDESYARIDTFDNSILNINSSVGLTLNSFGKFPPNYGPAL